MSWAFNEQSHRTAQLTNATNVIPKHHQRGITVARQAREAHRVGLGEQGSPIQHHEGEGAAAQQDVGAPGSRRRVVRTNHPHPFRIAQMHPVAGIEGTLGIDVGDPPSAGDRGFDHRPGQGGLSTPHGPQQLRQPPARQPPAEQHRIQRHDPGRDRRRQRSGRRQELRELGEREGRQGNDEERGTRNEDEEQCREWAENRINTESQDRATGLYLACLGQLYS
jgi:hypothetical protein